MNPENLILSVDTSPWRVSKSKDLMKLYWNLAVVRIPKMTIWKNWFEKILQNYKKIILLYCFN